MIELNKKVTAMRIFTRTGMLLLTLSCFIGLSSCGDDEQPANQLKVDGRTLKLKNAYILFSTGTDGDDTYNENIGFITTDGLTYDYDDDEFEGTGHLVVFYIVSEGETLQKDTYELDDSPDIGDLAFFQVGISIEDGSPTEAIYYATEGNVKVTSASSSKVTLKFDFDEYEFETMEDSGSGEEMTGYFSGKVEFHEESGLATRKAGKLRSILKQIK